MATCSSLIFEFLEMLLKITLFPEVPRSMTLCYFKRRSMRLLTALIVLSVRFSSVMKCCTCVCVGCFSPGFVAIIVLIVMGGGEGGVALLASVGERNLSVCQVVWK